MEILKSYFDSPTPKYRIERTITINEVFYRRSP